MIAMNATRQTLNTLIVFVQHAPENALIDIVTITFCGMSDSEVAAHIRYYAAKMDRARQTRLVELVRALNRALTRA